MPIAANIYYYQSRMGTGSHLPIVMIHGAGGSHLYWPPEMRQLSDFRIYSLDLPGHGKSGGHGLQSIDAYAEAIFKWMGEVGLHRAVFVGHSMGGAIALTLAQKYAEHVLGLGLIGTGARLRVDPVIIDNSANSQTFPAAISFIISKSFSEFADPRLVELAEMRLKETRPSVLHGDFIACNNFDMMKYLPKVNKPTLVVCGQDDELTPLRYAQYLSDSIFNAELQVIPNSGHMVMLEKPQNVANVVKEFLSRIPFHPGQAIKSGSI
jgi:pimeloyl-ACP methyl ester carboxylesterase